MDVAVESSEEVAPVRTAEQIRVEHELLVAEARLDEASAFLDAMFPTPVFEI